MDIYFDNTLISLDDDLLTDINGGGIFGVVSGTFEVIAGCAGVVGGILLLGVPEPTSLTKFAGWSAIVAGGAVILSGVATINSNR